MAPRLVVGPLLLLLGPAISIASTFLPFYPGNWYTPVLNGWQQIGVNIDNDRFYGWLMLVAFGVVGLEGILAVGAAVLGFARKLDGARVVALIAVGLGLLATAGVFAGYAVLGALDESTWGMWAYAASWLPAVVGAIGIASRKF